jgi:hypothetical protein
MIPENQPKRGRPSNYSAEIAMTISRVKGQPVFTFFLRDISERKSAERKIVRLSNLYAALSQTNQAITRLSDPQTLFDEVCRIAIEYGGFEMAAILMVDPETLWTRPVASSSLN